MGDLNNDPFMRNPNSGVQARAKAQNRANVMFLKQMGQSHPTGLTAPLLKLFEPRPPLEYKPPLEKRKCPPYSGMAQFVEKFAEPGDDEYAPPIPEVETPAQRRARIHQKRLEEGAQKAAEDFEKYDPNSDPNISGDPYKTLFVARLNYETTESRIKREFEAYGPIKRVGIVEHQIMGLRLCDLVDSTTNKPRGYAFIEYIHSRDMKAAYKQADGKKLDNRRVLVDVERGRTVKNWRPRRLGGGLGTTRVGGEELNQRTSGREQPQAGVISRSEEPRIQEDRDREKSRERVRDREREREKSREHSHDKPRDRDQRDDRHHRDRDRNRDKDTERSRDRERERTRDRGRDRGRDHDRERDRDRGHDRHREREKDRDRDYDLVDADYDRGRSRDREHEYDRGELKHDKDRKGQKERNYNLEEPEDGHERYVLPEHGQLESDNGRYGYYGHKEDREYENPDAQGIDDRYKDADSDHDRYEKMDVDNYKYDKVASRSQEREHDHHRSDRAHSREYDY